MDRRKFIRTIVAGGAGAASGLPFVRTYAAPPLVNSRWRRVVYAPAHKLRDGFEYQIPASSEQRDIIIVGAGPTSLCTAYHLPDADVLLLEKEAQTGGNAIRGTWQGIRFTNGTAYTDMLSPLADFARSEFGLEPVPLHSNDAYIVGNKVVPNLFRGGLKALPYSDAVKQDFARLIPAINELAERLDTAIESIHSGQLDVATAAMAEASALDQLRFSDWLDQRGFSPQVKEFCDLYCPPQVSSFTRNMSALTGIVGMRAIGDYEGSGTFPGGLAVLAESLADAVRGHGKDRIRTSAFVVRVDNTSDGDAVNVTYLHHGVTRTVRCKTCIWGAPKHIARRVISGMPKSRQNAIDKMVYNDISVMNLCYRRTIYDGAYYTWIDKAPVANILPADWVVNPGRGDLNRPQVLSCDWPNRPENRALLLNDEWVVAQCQKTAQRLNGVFPGSIDDLEEIRVVVRAHAWVVESPGYYTRILPQLPTSVGRVLITESDQGTFDLAYQSGLRLSQAAQELIA